VTEATGPEDIEPRVQLANAVTLAVATARVLGETAKRDVVESVTWEQAAQMIKVLRNARNTLADVEDDLERWVAKVWRELGLRDDTPVAGVGVVAVSRSRDRKQWDHDALIGLVVDAHLAGTDGEMPTPWEVAQWFRESAGFAYWKVTALRNLGIDPDSFCESTPGRPRVSITGSGNLDGEG